MFQENSVAKSSKFTAQNRNAHVVGFETRVGMARIDRVGVGGEGGGGAGCDQGNEELFQFHV